MKSAISPNGRFRLKPSRLPRGRYDPEIGNNLSGNCPIFLFGKCFPANELQTGFAVIIPRDHVLKILIVSALFLQGN
jgi:hypothetical protein